MNHKYLNVEQVFTEAAAMVMQKSHAFIVTIVTIILLMKTVSALRPDYTLKKNMRAQGKKIDVPICMALFQVIST